MVGIPQNKVTQKKLKLVIHYTRLKILKSKPMKGTFSHLDISHGLLITCVLDRLIFMTNIFSNSYLILALDLWIKLNIETLIHHLIK
jgi:hypothetical protein